MLKVNFKKLNENAVKPTYGTEFAAGADLYACEGGEVTIEAGETKLIHTHYASTRQKCFQPSYSLIYALLKGICPPSNRFSLYVGSR